MAISNRAESQATEETGSKKEGEIAAKRDLEYRGKTATARALVRILRSDRTKPETQSV